jgi:hypothetical protein
MIAGQWQDRLFSYGADKDAMRVSLIAGRTYDFKAGFDINEVNMGIRNRDNAILATAGPSVENVSTITFRPRVTGYYWLTAVDEGWEYYGEYRTFYARR